jgi:hypothetical protein
VWGAYAGLWRGLEERRGTVYDAMIMMCMYIIRHGISLPDGGTVNLDGMEASWAVWFEMALGCIHRWDDCVRGNEHMIL